MFVVQDGHISSAPVNARAFATFTLDQISERGSHLRMSGKRKVYVQLAGTQQLSGTSLETDILIDVDLGGVPDRENLLLSLPRQLFFDSIQEAYKGLPADRKKCILRQFAESTKSFVQEPECELPATADMVPPQLIHQVDPPFPDVPIPSGSYSVVLGLMVGEQGKPYDVHVIKSSRHELDTNAILAVKQYRFRPAMRHGQPIAMSLLVEVHFTRF